MPADLAAMILQHLQSGRRSLSFS